MQFTALAIAAFASSAYAVTQNCAANGYDSYCCSSVAQIQGTPVAVGVSCFQRPEGAACLPQKQKQCCITNATDAAHLVTFCRLDLTPDAPDVPSPPAVPSAPSA